jgi:hypothetical protein
MLLPCSGRTTTGRGLARFRAVPRKIGTASQLARRPHRERNPRIATGMIVLGSAERALKRADIAALTCGVSG